MPSRLILILFPGQDTGGDSTEKDVEQPADEDGDSDGGDSDGDGNDDEEDASSLSSEDSDVEVVRVACSIPVQCRLDYVSGSYSIYALNIADQGTVVQ